MTEQEVRNSGYSTTLNQGEKFAISGKTTDEAIAKLKPLLDDFYSSIKDGSKELNIYGLPFIWVSVP